jgi:hypothetical protein
LCAKLTSGGAVVASFGAVLDIVNVKDALADIRGCSSFAVTVKVYVPTSYLEVEVITSVSKGDQEIIP